MTSMKKINFCLDPEPLLGPEVLLLTLRCALAFFVLAGVVRLLENHLELLQFIRQRMLC